MRKFHRWIATLGMLLFLYVTITGTMLSITEYFSGPTILAADGKAISGPSTEATPGAGGGMPFVMWLKELHSGSFVSGGLWVDFFAGALLVVLSVTGIVMYFQMLSRRTKNGREGWFWR